MNIQIKIMTDKQVLRLSKGEVTKADTVDYRTGKTVPDGLMCQKIFGPVANYTCYCGRYVNSLKYAGLTCEHCGVPLIKKELRRERFGHISLAIPIVHIWFLKNRPGILPQLLEMSAKDITSIIYYNAYVVIASAEPSLSYKQVLSVQQYMKFKNQGLNFTALTGAYGIEKLLCELDLTVLLDSLSKKLSSLSGSSYYKVSRQFSVVQSFVQSGQNPTDLILHNILVHPAGLRPITTLKNGTIASCDLNELYRSLISRNNRLKTLIELNAPEVILNNERRLLQEAADNLFYNGKNGHPAVSGKRQLRSFSDSLKGKKGRFRANLLGKRVDYSGRSVISVGPDLKFNECGLPYDMALELFKPFIAARLSSEFDISVKKALKMVDFKHSLAYDALEAVIKDRVVILNRAPTLHRLGLQAFYPVLVNGKAIQLHPLVCTAYNADFDGDQMGVHLPLSEKAQSECKSLMLSSHNLLKPSDGGLVGVPSQDMTLGIYYLTLKNDGAATKLYRNFNEMLLAYENKYITLHEAVKVKISNKWGSAIIETTLGRMILNEVIPQNIGYIDRSRDKFSLEIDFVVKKGDLKNILQKIFFSYGSEVCADIMDKLKNLGYKYSTQASISVSMSDILPPNDKEDIINEAQILVDSIGKNYKRGLITDEERYKEVISVWTNADSLLTQSLFSNLDKRNNLFMMADSGARGSTKQIKQLAGMRGLMADTSGRTIEMPIKSNFIEGLDVLEYFMSAHGARKGMSDTALRTADSGYLTRRLVDVAQDVLVDELDCSPDGPIPYTIIEALSEDGEIIESLKDRLYMRVLAEDIYTDDNSLIAKANTLVTGTIADDIINKTQKKQIKIRNIQSCLCKHGVCVKCYGGDMANGKLIALHSAVGIIAAQSIGEPGTQLTMRTFHTGGVSGNDITQGLPRIEELFEARIPKKSAILSLSDGVVQSVDSVISILNSDSTTAKYPIYYGYKATIKAGDYVNAGHPLTDGSINLHDLLKITNNVSLVWNYIIQEVQKVYRLQGVEIADKHIEIIMKQMLKMVLITDSGDSTLLTGEVCFLDDVLKFNRLLASKNKNCIKYSHVIYGISKSALNSKSFLSSASFQETPNVLTKAAIRGSVDCLRGIKENVIVGNLIPSSTYTVLETKNTCL